MKTIEITTEAMPWANDAPQALGAVIDTDDETADAMVANGHAKIVAKRRKAAAEAAPEGQNADV